MVTRAARCDHATHHEDMKLHVHTNCHVTSHKTETAKRMSFVRHRNFDRTQDVIGQVLNFASAIVVRAVG